MTNSIVKFENQDIELLDIDGVPMMTLAQIGRALEASEKTNLSKLYTAHADEFTPEMTRIVKQGRTRVRVFNREGAWLIGMFARTPKAAAFRQWVLTALAAHVDGAKPVTVAEHTRSLPSGKKEIVLSEKAKQEIGGIVKAVVAKTLTDFFAPDAESHPSGMPFANWALSAVHDIGAMKSEYDALKNRVAQAQNILK